MHKPIQIKDYSFSLPHKTCFENFTTEVHPGSRIAIIGNNGSGKSTLLKMIKAELEKNFAIGYIPQIIEDHANLSGGQRFNAALTEAISKHPDILLLDEPTNHLDLKNRKSLFRLLDTFYGTLIIVSHDTQLLMQSTQTLWHIENGKIHIFSGKFDDYIKETEMKRKSLEDELSKLNIAKKATHEALMQEQKRAKKSASRGKKAIENSNSPTIVANAKASRAQETTGNKKLAINNKKHELTDKLSDLSTFETIKPKFDLIPKDVSEKVIVSINNGAVYYEDKEILNGIYLNLLGNEHIAITGDNGSGKSTLLKAIIGDSSIIKSGSWYAPLPRDIGYLDQHYSHLHKDLSPFDIITTLLPDASTSEIRKHLNEFLFRKNEEVNLPISFSSGGEKARLSLAMIAAKPPKLLILDEITNNIDLETRYHIENILTKYKGAMIVISHDQTFLENLGIKRELIL